MKHIIFLIAFLSSTSLYADEPVGPRLRFTNVVNRETVVKYFAPDTNESILSVLSYDDFERAPATCADYHCVLEDVVQLSSEFCYLGSLDHHVCPTLTRMSDISDSDYVGGLHEMITLTSCVVIPENRTVQAHFDARHDWERNIIAGIVRLSQCKEN
jgi:hypothetical protein